jgi:hypothetical protein
MPDELTSYLLDLMERMDSKEKLPGVEQVKSSADTVSWHAYQEVNKLANVGLLPAIRERIRVAKKSRDFQKLSFILGRLIHNTQDADAHAAFDYLMERVPASENMWVHILESARAARIASAKPHALRAIQEPSTKELALTAAIKYLGTMGGVDAIPLIGALLDADCEDRCHPMYCVVALQEIGHADALPYLQHAVDRHEKARKRIYIQTCAYAESAIEAIKYAPPPQINGMPVCAWTIPPDVPERIAVCESGESFSVVACDADWNPSTSHVVSTRVEATKHAKTLAGGKDLNWHLIPFYI